MNRNIFKLASVVNSEIFISEDLEFLKEPDLQNTRPSPQNPIKDGSRCVSQSINEIRLILYSVISRLGRALSGPFYVAIPRLEMRLQYACR